VFVKVLSLHNGIFKKVAKLKTTRRSLEENEGFWDSAINQIIPACFCAIFLQPVKSKTTGDKNKFFK